MARIVSANPVGSPPRDVVADASIFKRWLEAAVGDAALAADLATGANGETPINHSGAPLGCPLRLPLAAQHIGRSLALIGSATEEDFYILAVPVFVRVGEAGAYRLTVSTSPYGDDDVYAEVRDASWATFYGPSPGVRRDIVVVTEGVITVGSQQQRVATTTVFEWVITLGEGLQYLLVKRPLYLDDTDPGATLYWWTLDHDRTYAGDGNGLSIDGTTAIGSPYAALSTFTPSTVLDFYTEEVREDGPLSAFVLARLNRKLNALWEYVTGAKIPGNVAYQGSTTWDNSRATWTAEAQLEFPIAVVALGGGVAASGKPAATPMTGTPSAGLADWVRYATAHFTTMDNFCGLIFEAPSFSTSSSALKASILVEAPNGDSLANWRFDAIVDGLAAATEVTPVQIGATDYWLATVTAIPFTASSTNRINLRLRHTTAGALNDELQILGAALYFDP